MKKQNHFKICDQKPFRGCDYSKSRKIVEVIPNQSVTPSMMLDMAKQGIPISTDNAAAIEGEINPSWNLPSEKHKHIDPAELWQEQQTIRRKVREAYKRDKAMRKEKDPKDPNK